MPGGAGRKLGRHDQGRSGGAHTNEVSYCSAEAPNEVEYRSSEAPAVTPEEVAGDLAKVEALLELGEKAIPNMPRY